MYLWTFGPRRLSFSGLGVLISTSSPEKDTLLAPTVHKKIAHEIFKKEVFYDHPLLKEIKLYLDWVKSSKELVEDPFQE